ncbi:unnamed protein product [Pleuronectes platessa]|uniref:Uncharacterized protein n=1 Tax=Pleuronectes platessa TaxID=8262 RepID=A0A9N7UFA2_PLEPL|nr:unnamed protein product [Pleuronectes platessa]
MPTLGHVPLGHRSAWITELQELGGPRSSKTETRSSGGQIEKQLGKPTEALELPEHTHPPARGTVSPEGSHRRTAAQMFNPSELQHHSPAPIFHETRWHEIRSEKKTQNPPAKKCPRSYDNYLADGLRNSFSSSERQWPDMA